LKEFKA